MLMIFSSVEFRVSGLGVVFVERSVFMVVSINQSLG